MAQFLVTVLFAVIILVVLIIKLHVHPTISLFVAGMVTGLGMGYSPTETVSLFTSGFGSTLASIGCTIIFGSIIAQGIRDTNAVKSMVNFFIKLFRGKCLELTTALAGYIMSIPVFGDITQVLVAPIASVIAKRTNKSMSTMMSYTYLGLSLTHAMVPPTPGILAVAILLAADVGQVILWGVIVTVVAFMIVWLLTRKIVAKEYIEPRPDYVIGIEEVKSSDYHELLDKTPNLPPVLIAAAPILVPVILITAASFAAMDLAEGSTLRIVLETIGEKNVALFIGVILTWIVGALYKDVVKSNYAHYTGNQETSVFRIMVDSWVSEALNVAIIPLLVTAMGGGFSAIIKSYSGMNDLGLFLASFGVPSAVLPFVIAAMMQIAVGSKTTAGMTAAGICAPLLDTIGLSPLAAALLIGAGTSVGSHVNDSGFWVGCSLFNLNTKQGFKYITALNAFTAVICFGILEVLIVTGIM